MAWRGVAAGLGTSELERQIAGLAPRDPEDHSAEPAAGRPRQARREGCPVS